MAIAGHSRAVVLQVGRAELPAARQAIHDEAEGPALVDVSRMSFTTIRVGISKIRPMLAMKWAACTRPPHSR
jgi:hypothetical protein